MNTTAGQKALLQVWAEGTTFVYDPEKRPKAEFARLAKAKGWIGDVPVTTTMNTLGSTSGNASPTQLTGRMRRLSVGSDTSSYSLISAGSSVISLQSLNTNGSVAGGVVLPRSPEPTKSKSKPKKSRKSARINSVICSTASTTTSPADTQESESTSRLITGIASAKHCSLFWQQFQGFEPAPTASFKDEFARLAKQQGWGTKTKRKHQVEALTAEIAFHYGKNVTKLDRWQELCKEMGVKDVPTSITKCKKALQTVYVNLFNLIDHRRNSEVKIVHFKSHSDFCRHIHAGNTFPRQCAKQDGFISVLLKRL